MSNPDDPTVPPPGRRLPPIRRPPKIPGSQDSHPVLNDEQAARFWEELQTVEERVQELEQERGRDLVKQVTTTERLDSLSADTDELWRELRGLRKRFDASIQDDVVTARQIADLEKRLALRFEEASARVSARADLAAEEVAGPLAARTGNREARKWAALVTGLGILAEIIRWYVSAQGK